MNYKEFKNLLPGDIVKPYLGSKMVVVTANYGDRVTGVVTYDITNPQEWEIIRKHTHDSSFDMEKT